MSRLEHLITFTVLGTLLCAVLAWAASKIDRIWCRDNLPPDMRLRRKGLDLALAGRPEEAEKYFRGSLILADSSHRVRSLVCLADALMDQGRLEEAKEHLTCALELGDETASGPTSMADLLLLTGTDPEQALAMADEALNELPQRSVSVYFSLEVSHQLWQATFWAQRARALAQLDRREEARQAVDQALQLAAAAEAEAQRKKFRATYNTRVILGSRRLAKGRDTRIAYVHWHIGLALLAIDDSGRAAEHFRITRNTDRRGKYRNLAHQQLKRLDSQL